jgi:predicted metal-dependent peptidase
MASMNPKEKMAAGRLVAVRRFPYFTDAITSLVPVEMQGLGTFGVTERGVMYWDPAVVDEWTVPEICGAIVHESQHMLRDHAGRRKTLQADHELFNVAGDMEINDDFPPAQLKLPGKPLYPSSFGLEEGMTAEAYYRALEQQQQQQQQGGEGDGQGKGEAGDGSPGDQSGKSEDDEGEGEAGGQSQGQGQDQGGKGSPGGQGTGKGQGEDEVGAGGCGGAAGNPRPFEQELDEAHGRSDRAIAQTRRTVAEAVERAASSGRGDMPGGLLRWAKEQLAPPTIPWRQKLARLVRCATAYRAGAVDMAYDRISRRQAGAGFGRGRPVLPAYRAPVPRVAVIVDTSGSMGSEEVSEAVAETAGILKATGSHVRFVACDTRAHGVHKVSTWQRLKDLLVGGGGTNMRPAFDALAREKERTDVIVCVTDGEIGNGYPDRQPPRTHVIWVAVGGMADRFRPRWGEVVVVDRSAA